MVSPIRIISKAYKRRAATPAAKTVVREKATVVAPLVLVALGAEVPLAAAVPLAPAPDAVGDPEPVAAEPEADEVPLDIIGSTVEAYEEQVALGDTGQVASMQMDWS